MMAARAMGIQDCNDKGRVVACESYLPMIKLMRKVVHCNGMSRKINVINKRSDELKLGVDITARADILVGILHQIFFLDGKLGILNNNSCYFSCRM